MALYFVAMVVVQEGKLLVRLDAFVILIGFGYAAQSIKSLAADQCAMRLRALLRQPFHEFRPSIPVIGKAISRPAPSHRWTA